MGSCSVFGGSVVIDGEKLSDTFTRINGVKHARRPAASALTDGLK
jgi:hypothetical protein